MVLKLLTLLAIGVTAVAATLAPLHPRDTADGNTCTFHASIVETCASTTPVTYANIPSIHTPSGANLPGTSYLLIAYPNHATVKLSDPTGGIDNVLSVEQQQGGVVKFGWEYGLSRDGKALYYWTEDKNGWNGLFGCDKVAGWSGEKPDCGGARGSRTKEMDCFFKCRPPTSLR